MPIQLVASVTPKDQAKARHSMDMVFTFTFYVAFTSINFSDFDVGCIFRPALVC